MRYVIISAFSSLDILLDISKLGCAFTIGKSTWHNDKNYISHLEYKISVTNSSWRLLLKFAYPKCELHQHCKKDLNMKYISQLEYALKIIYPSYDMHLNLYIQAGICICNSKCKLAWRNNLCIPAGICN